MRADRSRSRSNSMISEQDNRKEPSPPSNTVYVTFLPESIDESTLRTMFSEIGSVNRLNLKRKDDGFTFAFISYDDVADAERATQRLNRKKVDGKFISVKFAKQQANFKNEGQKRDNNDRDFGQKNFGEKKKFDNKREFDRDPRRDGNREERKPMKCFKCHGEGHISKNCPEDGRKKEDVKYETRKPSPPEDQFCDY